MTTEITSAMGWAYKIPFMPHTIGSNKMTGTKQIPCLHAPKKKPMVWGMNGILYAQPIADVISVVITIFMALHLHRELSRAEKQAMSNSEM